MKKLLGIIVLGLLLSGNAYAGLLNFGFSDKLKKISPGDNPSKVEKNLESQMVLKLEVNLQYIIITIN